MYDVYISDDGYSSINMFYSLYVYKIRVMWLPVVIYTILAYRAKCTEFLPNMETTEITRGFENELHLQRTVSIIDQIHVLIFITTFTNFDTSRSINYYAKHVQFWITVVRVYWMTWKGLSKMKSVCNVHVCHSWTEAPRIQSRISLTRSPSISLV